LAKITTFDADYSESAFAQGKKNRARIVPNLTTLSARRKTAKSDEVACNESCVANEFQPD
jgi:hypothetical protein